MRHGDPRHVADQHRPGEQLGQEAEPQQPSASRQNTADQTGEAGGERGVPLRVSAGEAAERRRPS